MASGWPTSELPSSLMWSPDNFILRLCVLLLSASRLLVDSEQIFCQNEVFRAQCAQNEVISIRRANYGRMHLTRCVERDYGYISCGMDVRRRADRMCSGRHECEIPIPNTKFDEDKKCPGDLKSYLEIEYDCIEVITSRQHCHSTSTPVLLTDPSGYLASAVTMDTKIGSPDCPYIIQGQPGQSINISLLDYSTCEDGELCSREVAYAVLSEKTPPRTRTVYRGRETERHVFISSSSTLIVRMNAIQRQQQSSYFMLKYQITGCPDPNLPPNVSHKRSGNRLDITCKANGKSYHLVCDDRKWTGDFDNCTAAGTGVVDEVRMGFASLPFGASLAVIVLIAIALGVLILIAGLLIIRCKRKQQASLPHQPDIYRPSYKDPTVLPRAYIPPTRIEQESAYQTENEYAYISDLIPQTAPTSNPHLELQPRKCSDYGTASTYAHSGGHTALIPCEPDANTTTTTCYFGDGNPVPPIPRYVDNIESAPMCPRSQQPLPKPPDYFVVDPEKDAGKGKKASGSQPSQPQRASVHAPGCCAANNNPVMKRMNQSIHEFNTCVCDHLIQNPEDTNHKSV